MMLCVDDYRKSAERKLTKPIFGYIEGGALDEVTLEANTTAFRKLFFVPRVMVDCSQVDMSTTVVGGHTIDMPIMIAPTAAHRLAHPKGEIDCARAAARNNTLFCISSVSNSRVEDCATAMREEYVALGGPVPDKLPMWFQLYVLKNMKTTEKIVRRAEAAGCSAVVVTVDTVVPGRRENNMRNKFQYPPDVVPVMFSNLYKRNTETDSNTYLQGLFSDSLNWEFLAVLRGLTSLPIIIKGVLSPEDAATAARLGAAAVVVSNHGGRQLDSALPSILALPGVVKAVKEVNPNCQVYHDGGIRRGNSVLKAMALGADGCLVGRPIIYGLAHAGVDGVDEVLKLLRAEFKSACAQSGVAVAREAVGRRGLITTMEKILASL